YNAQAFQTYLKTNRKSLKPLEGIWQNEAGNYTVGIRYQNDKYTAFILKADSIYWMPGQIKMEIGSSKESVNFYMRDHSLQTYTVNMDDIGNGYFDIQNIGKWLKLDDKGKIVYKDYYPNAGIVSFKKINDNTNLITIRSFSEEYRKLIDSVVSANDKTIRAADNLIIDVRGNGGGSDISYAPLEKYLFTHPYISIGAEVYCTNDNIDKFRGLVTNPVFTPQEQENFKTRVKGMEQHLNQYWSSYPVYNNSDTFPVLAQPKRIAVIIDSFCGSTTEQFLLDPVLNSKKVTIFGTHSAGVLDYANNYFFRVPNTDFTVNYPTSRSSRIDLGKGIDNKGIQPNIQLDNSTKDWVKYASNYLEKQAPK
ncbi:MAG TPA: S41 family peptidase, partial [Chitinophagaceae bacterium]|nr:S41 family peptidase [Chitinophagaceae bacterium]